MESGPSQIDVDPGVDVKRTGLFPPAEHELSDQEIQEIYGDLLEESQKAFLVDPEYLISMMEQLQTKEVRKVPARARTEEQKAIMRKRVKRLDLDKRRYSQPDGVKK